MIPQRKYPSNRLSEIRKQQEPVQEIDPEESIKMLEDAGAIHESA